MSQHEMSEQPAVEEETTHPAATLEEMYPQKVERTALWALMITAVATMLVTYLANLDRETIPITPDRGSVGFQYLVATMVATLILTPYAYSQAADYRNRRLPVEMRRRYTWSIIPITLAVTLFVGLVAFVNVDLAEHAFIGSGWDSGLLVPGATYKVRVATTGTFTYADTVEALNRGAIVVAEGAGVSHLFLPAIAR